MESIFTFARNHWAKIGLVVCALIAVCTGHLAAALGGGGLIFGTLIMTDEQIRYLVKTGLLDAAGGLTIPKVLAKTVAGYTVLAPTASTGDAARSVFTNRGVAGSVTYTLPAPVPALTGLEYEFWGVADQNTVVNAGGAGKGVAFNNAAITTTTCSTAGGKIGAHIRVVCDGTSWLFENDIVGVTYTLA